MPSLNVPAADCSTVLSAQTDGSVVLGVLGTPIGTAVGETGTTAGDEGVAGTLGGLGPAGDATPAVEYVATKPLPCTVLSLVNTTWNRPEATCNAAGNELPLRVASGMPTAEVPSYTCTKMASLHRRQARMQPVASVAGRQGSYPHVVVALL